MNLTILQAVRELNCGSRHSSVFYWAMCIAINAYIGVDPATTVAADLIYLMEALKRQCEGRA